MIVPFVGLSLGKPQTLCIEVDSRSLQRPLALQTVPKAWLRWQRHFIGRWLYPTAPLVISKPANSWLMEINILNDLTLFDADVTLLISTTNTIDFTSKEDSVLDFYSSSDKIYILDSLELSDSTMSFDITDQYLVRFELE